MRVRTRAWLLLVGCAGGVLWTGGPAQATGRPGPASPAPGPGTVAPGGVFPAPRPGSVAAPRVVSAAVSPPRTGPAPAAAPRADLAFHGHAVIDGDRMEVRLTPRDHGPAAVPEASVRVRWSVGPAGAVTSSPGCARTGERTVVCGTGALVAGQAGQEIRLGVRLRVPAPEVTLEVETAWNGGVTDPDRTNDRLRVLVLPTGDEYSF
ncbi:hypothetical protein EV284_1235 [Streptomyces sp. BK022]|uniref:hypothetical protein n=1 Tax=Streptomyces sp. BK022 TaxID=2512123 RepID=UPI0010ECCF0A|nr:hypothetical protein [Streptomyces sp. BK022]RZU43784.1 hypothetical protein EV284_1235 [Streptomyces sp. BK022]